MRGASGVLAACLAALVAAEGSAQTLPESIRTTAGPQYSAGSLRRFLLGSGYRHLWTAPVTLEVLDLATFAGGLRPVKTGGGKQTISLHFESSDGRRFKARSVDKQPGRALPKAVRPLAESLVEDTTSALVPGGPLVIAPLLEAAEIFHVEPRLVVLPDDPALGEFREEFAGKVVTLEEVPTPGRTAGFETVTEIVDWEELAPRLAAGGERVDARAFLRARLVDLWLGDWDRHDLQWDWARDDTREGWQPVPVDRDAAFSRYDGLLLDLVRPWQPRLVSFGRRYPDVGGLTWNARFVDRRFLAGLEWPVWEETVADLQRRIADDVIDGAVARLPPEYAQREGRRLAAALRSRRDRLPDVARKHYLNLAEEVTIEATDAAESVEATFAENGSLDVVVSPASEQRPFVRRRFLPEETSEVRLLLRGGDDRAVVRGPSHRIRLRIVGGAGDDLLDDSRSSGTRVYDESGENRVLRGPGTTVDGRPYVHPKDGKGNPMRDWGRATVPILRVEASPDSGLVAGGGVRHTRYAFRRHPFEARHELRLDYSTGATALRAAYDAEVRRVGSRTHAHVFARASGFEMLRFHGFGNETAEDLASASYRVHQRRLELLPVASLPIRRGEVNLGPALKYQRTRLANDSLVGRERPYGSEPFGQLGARVEGVIDSRDSPSHPSRGLRVETGASAYPRLWSVASPFAHAHANAASYVSAPSKLQPTVAVRAGARRTWGRYPFHEAAYLGAEEVRGLRLQRYAGDASAFGTVELRARAGAVGAFALVDAGRVFLAGAPSKRWHTATGGGLRVALPGEGGAVVVTAATTGGKWRFYATGGKSF